MIIRQTFRATTAAIWVVVTGVVLAACGGQAAAPAPTTAPPAPTRVPAVPSPVAPTTVPSPLPPTTAAVATVAPPTAAVAPTAAGPASLYAGIEQGKTTEGYQALGAANAPVTLVMYSDFL